MNDIEILQNLVAFMDRVPVTGRKEVQAYADCLNWLEEKIANNGKETSNISKG